MAVRYDPPMSDAGSDWFLKVLRSLPSGLPGKTRIGHRRLKSMPDGPASVHLGNGLSMSVPSIREPIAQHLLVDGSYERDVHRWIVRRLVTRCGTGSPAVFVDVGANIGAHTVPVACELGSRIRVIAFEPSPRLVACLRSNVARNGLGNCDVQPFAAGAAAGVREFFEAPETSFGMGSFAPQFSAIPHGVNVVTLDSALGPPEARRADVMKVDVEGFEADVFLGARGILTGPTPPEIIFEFCDWAEERAGYELGRAQTVLLDLGFELALLRSDGSEGDFRKEVRLRKGGAMLIGRRAR